MALTDDAVEAVLFDAGGVLLLPDPERIRGAFAHFGASPDDDTCRLAHYKAVREFDRLGRADWSAAGRVVARTAGVPEDRLEEALPAVERIYLMEDWVPVPGAADALLALEASGLRLGVVSNATGRTEQMLRQSRICSLEGGTMAKVAVIVDSHIVGVEKPDPRIFALAIPALGVPPEHCLYVGDSVHFDVEGARSAGIRALHLDPFRLCPAEDHGHLAALDELGAALAVPEPGGSS